MSRLRIGTLLVVALMPSLARAQAEAPPTPRAALTLRAAIDEALARNPEVIALQRDYDAARRVPETQKYLMPPMAEVQIWAWPVTTIDPREAEMYMFMGEQQLPGRGKRAARVAVAERDADLARQQIAATASQIAGEVREAVIDLAFTRETFALYDRQQLLLEELAASATSRYAAGEGPQHHTVTTVVQLAVLARERISAEERAQSAEARLNTLLGRPAGDTVEALDVDAEVIAPSDAEQLALERHPQVAMVAAAVAREEAELARLRGERRPDFVVGAGYMMQPGEAGAWTARGGITWPNAPWSRGRLNSEIEVQAQRVEAARARGDVVAAQLRRTVREAAVRVEALERQLRLIDETVLPQIEHALELSRLAYAAGEGEFTQILEERRLLLATALERVASRAALARARADLQTAAGVR